MEKISARISMVVKESGLNKSEFAKKLNVSQPHVSRMCSGETQPSDRTISDICREFDVNENWLRYGKGPMKNSTSREEEIEALMRSALKGSNDFKKAVIQAVCARSESELEALEKLLWDIVYNLPEKKNAQAESRPGRTIIKIAGRDGSLEERALTDEELEQLRLQAETLPDVPKDF